MKYKLIDRPVYIQIRNYEDALQRLCGRLQDNPQVKAVYQIGSVSVPGISDLDVVTVFNDGAKCVGNYRQGMSETELYLFMHNLYGATESDFRRVQAYSLFHNYKQLSGPDLLSDIVMPAGEHEECLKTQIAIEFLVKMLANMVVQREYGVFKLRGFFLHVRGVSYDLEFLGIDSGALADTTRRWIEIRSNWFEHQPPDNALADLLDDFHDALVKQLREILRTHIAYLPERKVYSIAPGMHIENSNELGWRRSGLLLPRFLCMIGPKYFNLQHRFNRFTFELPFTAHDVPGILGERFGLVDRMRAYQASHLPYFAIMTSSLVIQ